MLKRLRLKNILVTALCAGSVIEGVHAAEHSKAEVNAAFILGNLDGRTAFLIECADYDRDNADSYADIMSRYVEENKNLADRVMTIMRIEYFRTGRTLEDLSKFLSDGKKRGAEKLRKQRQDDPNFLNDCRKHLETYKAGLSVYRLRQKFPVQMRVIDDWK